MLKIRITFIDNKKGNEELKEAITSIKKDFDVINKSRIYKGRNNSQYSSIYIDVESKGDLNE